MGLQLSWRVKHASIALSYKRAGTGMVRHPTLVNYRWRDNNSEFPLPTGRGGVTEQSLPRG